MEEVGCIFEDWSTNGEQDLLKLDSNGDEEEEEVDIKCWRKFEGGSTKGEQDLLMFDSEDNEEEEEVDIKCWRRFEDGSTKGELDLPKLAIKGDEKEEYVDRRKLEADLRTDPQRRSRTYRSSLLKEMKRKSRWIGESWKNIWGPIHKLGTGLPPFDNNGDKEEEEVEIKCWRRFEDGSTKGEQNLLQLVSKGNVKEQEGGYKKVGGGFEDGSTRRSRTYRSSIVKKMKRKSRLILKG